MGRGRRHYIAALAELEQRLRIPGEITRVWVEDDGEYVHFVADDDTGPVTSRGSHVASEPLPCVESLEAEGATSIEELIAALQGLAESMPGIRIPIAVVESTGPQLFAREFRVEGVRVESFEGAQQQGWIFVRAV